MSEAKTWYVQIDDGTYTKGAKPNSIKVSVVTESATISERPVMVGTFASLLLRPENIFVILYKHFI